MSALARNAKTALAVYLARGRDAVACLAEGRFDDANAILQRRNAAFHNFRAVDALALRDGADLRTDPEALAMWDEIRLVEKRLQEGLEKAREETAELYNKIRETRAKISAYRSKRAVDPRFEKTA